MHYSQSVIELPSNFSHRLADYIDPWTDPTALIAVGVTCHSLRTRGNCCPSSALWWFAQLLFGAIFRFLLTHGCDYDHLIHFWKLAVDENVETLSYSVFIVQVKHTWKEFAPEEHGAVAYLHEELLAWKIQNSVHIVVLHVLICARMYDLVALGEGRVDFLKTFRACVHSVWQLEHRAFPQAFQCCWHILEQVQFKANVRKLGQADLFEFLHLSQVVDKHTSSFVDLQSRCVLWQVVQKDIADVALGNEKKRLVESAL